MSVYKKVQLPSKIMCSSAVRCCPEDDIAIASDEGIYVLSMRTMPSLPSSEPVMHISKIDARPDVNEFDIGIDRETIQQDIIDSGEIVGDVFEIMLNRTLSPAVESVQTNRGFMQTAWSPLGADLYGRRVLATLTADHRVSIYTRKGASRTWDQAANVSLKFQELMKSEGFLPAEERMKQNNKHEKSKIVRLKERTYLLAAVALSWSKTFHGCSNESPSKRRKTEEKSNGTPSVPFCFLATVFKSGHVALWKIKLPIKSEKEVTFSELIDLHSACPKTAHWCAFSNDSDNPGILAVGYTDGTVRILGLQWMEGTREVTSVDKPCQVWADADNIPVFTITWDSERRILLFGKGPYLFAVTVDISSNGTFILGKTSHLAVSPKTFINEIQVDGDGAWVSTTDDVLARVRVTFNEDNALDFSIACRAEPPRDLTGPMYPWKNHGFCWSRNKTFLSILSSPGWNYCHLDTRKPLKFDMLSRITPDEATDLLLAATPTTPLTHYSDVLIYIKQVYKNTGTFPDILDMLVKDTEGWDSLSLFNLKLLRFLLRVETAYCKEKKERKEELEKVLIPKSTVLILTATATRTLKSIEPLLKPGANLSKEGRLSCLLLTEWVSQHSSEPDEKDMATAVRKTLGKTGVETCIICSESRCVQSLILCQDVPYRVCGSCGVLAVNKSTDCPILQRILSDRCSLCDSTLLLST